MTCAFAVRGALKKFPGVESVDVSLNKGLATVKLKPGNSVRPQEFWETVRKNGFTPKETKVVVRGEFAQSGKQWKVAGTNEVFTVSAAAAVVDEAKGSAGKMLTVEGSLLPGKDVKVPVPLQVNAIRK
ncbi:MAG: heavy metal-associated domain-containing protein [Bryobacteraceae bacterium]